MFNLWQSNFVKERAAISFPSAVVCLGHCSPYAAREIQMPLAALRLSWGWNCAVFPAAIFPWQGNPMALWDWFCCKADSGFEQTELGGGMWMWVLGNKTLWGSPWASKQKYTYLWRKGAEGEESKMLPSSTGLGRHRRHHLTLHSLKDQLFENCLIT